MRDKEKNNSLKNQDKNFNENFTQEKEQIMIDGVDVNKCERHCSDNYNTPNMCYSDITRGYRHCNPKENQCDFYIASIEEQLARKTQECEELKESVDKIKNYVKNQMFDVDCKNWFDRFIYTFEDWKKSICEANDRYRKALEEIEEFIKNLEKQDILTFPDFPLQENYKVIMKQCNRGYIDILDIISKAKTKGE